MLTNKLRPLCLMRMCEGSNPLQTIALIAFCSSVVARCGRCLSWVTRPKKVSLCLVASSGSVAAAGWKKRARVAWPKESGEGRMTWRLRDSHQALISVSFPL